MRLRSSPILGLICLGSILAMDTRLDCKDVAINGLLDAVWFGAGMAANQAMIDANQGQQGERGDPGAPGANCWDLNDDGVNDPNEDVNGDGVWDTFDCQGLPGDPGLPGRETPGPPGADGQDGADGADGLPCWDLNGNGQPDADEDVSGPDGVPDGLWDAWDCQGLPGQDGEDLTGVIARGVIPGADIPEPNEPDWVPDPNTAVGILRVYRPENPQGPTTRGRYRVIVELPERAAPYTNPEIITLVSIVAVHTDGGLPGSGGPTAQAFGFWEIVVIDNAASTVELEVMIRTAPLNFFTDATFSLVVLVP
ncbi:MAG: hypothetical protein ACE5I3_07720 [Phycisphaerae bacterium]